MLNWGERELARFVRRLAGKRDFNGDRSPATTPVHEKPAREKPAQDMLAQEMLAQEMPNGRENVPAVWERRFYAVNVTWQPKQAALWM